LATGNVPVTPLVKGKPVTLVITPEAGVPSAGVTRVGLVARTMPPEPVTALPRAVATPVPRAVTPVPPAEAGSVPVAKTEVDVA